MKNNEKTDWLKQWIHLDYINPEDFPNIDLYMDQVLTFMDNQLQKSKRYESDKIMTKTMINNYAKNKLIPPPTKKKYSKNHLYLLVYIYYFKNILSISDIQNLLGPLTDKYYTNSDKDEIDFTKIYQEIFDIEHEYYYEIEKQLMKTHEEASRTFQDCSNEKDREFLTDFSLIAMLSYDIYIRKQIVEKIIDKYYTDKDSKH